MSWKRRRGAPLLLGRWEGFSQGGASHSRGFWEFAGWGALSHALSLLQFVDLFQDWLLGLYFETHSKNIVYWNFMGFPDGARG